MGWEVLLAHAIMVYSMPCLVTIERPQMQLVLLLLEVLEVTDMSHA